MPHLSLIERVSESITLSRAHRTAEATPERVRIGLAEDLALSRQTADAAESLFDNGHPAEAIQLAREALERALDAVGHLEPVAPGTAGETKTSEVEAKAIEVEAKAGDARVEQAVEAWQRILAGRGAAPDVLRAVAEVAAAARSGAVPRLDAQVTADHATGFHRVLAARVAIDREVHPAALTVAQVRAKRRNRIALALLTVAAAVAGAYFALRRPTGTFAEASAYFGNNAQFAPENAIDGDPATEWLLPDRTSGWLDVSIGPPRRIAALSIVNASNQPHEDRATREYTVEVWAHGELARSVQGTLPFSTARNAVRHEIDVEDVERVRVVVRSWHQLGAGIAEVRFE
ncbi:MAG: discoidin domain-containing protein [Deltaproteobacteria bacterium]